MKTMRAFMAMSVLLFVLLSGAFVYLQKNSIVQAATGNLNVGNSTGTVNYSGNAVFQGADASGGSGTIACSNGSATVTGTNTAFTTEVIVGDWIKCSSQRKAVTSVQSNTSLTVTSAFTVTASGQANYIMHPIARFKDYTGTTKYIVDPGGNFGAPGGNFDVGNSGVLTEGGVALSSKYAYVGGGNATGTWGISVSGNAATATSATNISAYTINQNVGTANSPTFAGLTLTGTATTRNIDLGGSGTEGSLTNVDTIQGYNDLRFNNTTPLNSYFNGKVCFNQYSTCNTYIDTSGNGVFVGSGTFAGITSSSTGIFGTAGGSRVQITAGGGANAISETYNVDANPRWQIGRDLVSSGVAGIGFINSGGTLAANGVAVGMPASRNLAFYTSNATALTEAMRIDGSNEVGIGTTAPAAILDVNGAQIFRQRGAMEGTGASCSSVGDGSAGWWYADAGDCSTVFAGINSATNGSESWGVYIGAWRWYVDVSGNSTLTGNQTIQGTTGLTASGTGAGLNFSGTGTHTVQGSSGTLQINAFTLGGTLTGNSQTVTGVGTFSAGAATVTGLTVNGNGNVTGTLNVKSGTNSGDAIYVGNDAKIVDVDVSNVLGIYSQTDAATYGGIRVGSATGGSSILYGTSTGFGIGTSAPNGALSVVTTAVSRFTDNTTTDGVATNPIRLNLGTAVTGTSARFIRMYAAVSSGDNGGTGVGYIKLNNSAVALGSGSADFAEYFSALEEGMKAGEVMALVNGKVKRATSSDDVVVGVISDHAIVIGNSPPNDENPNFDKGYVIVGLRGQVKTYLSTANGPIKSGDPLMASSVPGVAVKATRAGMIIGNAIEDYTNTDPSHYERKNIIVNISWFDPGTDTKRIDSQQKQIDQQQSEIDELKKEIQDLKKKLN